MQPPSLALSSSSSSSSEEDEDDDVHKDSKDAETISIELADDGESLLRGNRDLSSKRMMVGDPGRAPEIEADESEEGRLIASTSTRG